MLLLATSAPACTLASSGTNASPGAGGAGGADGPASSATSGGAGPGATSATTTSGATTSASATTSATSGTGGSGAGGSGATGTGGASATSSASGTGGAVNGSGGQGGGGGAPPCTGATEFTDPATGHCYYYVDGPDLDWNNAEGDCKTWGGHLARINDEAERAFINAEPKVLSADFWIGGFDEDNDGTFYWLNNEGPVVTTMPPWKANEPNNPATEQCMKHKSGLFESAACGGAKEYLCEM